LPSHDNTWKPRENLGNIEDLVQEFEQEFEQEYREIGRVRKRKNDEEHRKEELPGRYMAKMLYRWDNKRFDKEY